jgi:signal transduction histidine kinase
MNYGGRLTLRTTRQNDYIILEVEDTGAGFNEDCMANLFKLFYTTKARGSGLGLPVTKKIVDDHGGYINVNSTPGKGTIFTVHLPDSTERLNAENFGLTN